MGGFRKVTSWVPRRTSAMTEPTFKKLPNSPEIQLDDYGRIIGKIVDCGEPSNSQAMVFMSIPFAKPPIGDLRFRHPQPPEPIGDDVLECFQFPPRGIQRDPFVQKKWRNPEKTSEDSLYLNVFAPTFSPTETSSTQHPVMVFVHGGAFVSDGTKKYGMQGICDVLVTPHNIVVVTVQYRLGYLGFFTTGDGRIPDNLGLFDLKMSLEWVQKHIHKFGGDPHNITLAGQSAGGALVEFLSLSPLTWNLFHKIMPMAGNAHCMWAMNDKNVETCRKRMRRMGIKPTLTTEETDEALRIIDAMEFGTKMKLSSSGYGLKPSTEISPRIVPPFFPKSLDELRAEAPVKPILVGVSEHEGLLFQLIARKMSSVDLVEEILAETIPESEPGFAQRRRLLTNMYIRLHVEDKLSIREVCTRLFTDVVMGAPTQKYVRQQIDRGNQDVYLYCFTHFNKAQIGLARHILPFDGATHCNELVYLFRAFVVNKFSLSSEDRKMISLTTQYFSNFCRYGNPNGDPSLINLSDSDAPLTEWAPTTAENPARCILLKTEPEMSENFMDGRADQWVKPLSSIQNGDCSKD
ncbi:unnamed protein product [Bursaphelenchus xylophilus]|uniref:Carboxylic ester hydrolase n=1 Tax=Bursaphelenchus xylophilus TaxID=6326 RepID=A0A1I7RZ52_BURXY|nr:unnamed protein product [Bursaphelenchus xylophilus]CAG9106846.1 unnamed protein product [Bursaphelenchus xylophilus]